MIEKNEFYNIKTLMEKKIEIIFKMKIILK